MKFQKCTPYSISPTRAHDTDAGWDLYYSGQESRLIPPYGSTLLRTGIRVEIPEGYFLQVENRSGIASKKGLIRGATWIDRFYDGEIFVNLINPKPTAEVIEAGAKIAQCGLMPLPNWEFVEAGEDEVLNKDSERGSKGFGSSGM